MYDNQNQRESSFEVYQHAINFSCHTLTFRFFVCKSIANFYQTHYFCKKRYSADSENNKTRRFSVLKLPQFFIENVIVLVSNSVSLEKKTRGPPSHICSWSNSKQRRFHPRTQILLASLYAELLANRPWETRFILRFSFTRYVQTLWYIELKSVLFGFSITMDW